MIIDPPAGDADGAIELYNSDGSRAEISGNGTRCAAAFLLEADSEARRYGLPPGQGPSTCVFLSAAGTCLSSR